MCALAGLVGCDDSSSSRAPRLDGVGRAYTAVRLTAEGADRFVPFDPLAPRQGSTAPPVALLAALERVGAHDAVAAVHVLHGHPAMAETALGKVPEGPSRTADLAAARLARGDVPEALRRLSSVLDEDPAHAQARWNRALARARLGLPLAAAADFDRVAALGEPGWSRTASAAAARLRARVETERQAWYAARDAGAAMVATGTPVSAGVAEAFPGLTRLYLYDALRSVETATGARALRDVAEIVDRHDGGTRLQDWVDATTRRDFAVRGPIARRFRALAVRGWLPRADLDPLLAAARAAKQTDILLGALYLGRVEVTYRDEYARLAEAARDPWFTTLDATVQADAARLEGRLDVALSRLQAAVDGSRVGYRTSHAELLLVQRQLHLHQIESAREHLSRLAVRASSAGEWSQHLKTLQLLARLHIFEDDPAIAAAYLREVELREPDRCDTSGYIREAMLEALLFMNRREEAVRLVNAPSRCSRALTDIGVHSLVEISRSGPIPYSAEQLEAEIDELIARAPDEAERLFLRAARGAFRSQRADPRGQEELHDVIRGASAHPTEDARAQRAEAQAYFALVARAGADGRFGEAYDLLAERLGAAPRPRCGLAVFVEDERRLLVMRDADGAEAATFDLDNERSPSALELGALVPPDWRWQGCQDVAVYTHPPLVGRPGLLPNTVPWFYAMGGRRSGGRPPRDRGHVLRVAEVRSPPGLDLPALPAYEVSAAEPAPDVLLRGAAATPEAVLDAMERASEIEVFAHGYYDLGASAATMLVLSPNSEGRYALTARQIASSSLPHRPVVFLAACQAARTTRYRNFSFSLPASFIEAGAESVVASWVPVPSLEGQAFFRSVRAAVRAGRTPAAAVRRARAEAPEGSWMDGVVVLAR